MYPYASDQVLRALQQERNQQLEGARQDISTMQQNRPAARSLALMLGHALVALGNRLELLGQY